MWLVTLIAILLFVGFIASLIDGIEEACVEAKRARDVRNAAAYRAAEAARMHAWNLERIERVRKAATEEMLRVAFEDSGEVIEGTAVEVTRHDRA